MNRSRTIHVNIDLTDDPEVLKVRIRLGNGYRRATIRKEGAK